MNATIHDDAQRVFEEMISGNYYSLLGVQPQLGRAMQPGYDTAASRPAAVISDELWDREFGRSLERSVNGSSSTILP